MRLKSWILALLLLPAALRSAEAESVTLAEESSDKGPSYRIEGIFEVSAPRSEVWQVLTDYNGLKGVVSTMQDSKVVERKGDEVLVEQVAIGRFMFFSKTIKLLLKISEIPQSAMLFEEVSGKAFRLYHGSWELADTASGVKVRYELQVSSADMAPAFLERGLFKDSALALLKELKGEIIRRTAASAQGTNKKNT